MATITLTATNVCPGGNHVTIRFDFNGVEQFTRVYELDFITASLNSEDADAFVRSLIRAHKVGKTPAQVKTDLLVGLNVTV